MAYRAAPSAKRAPRKRGRGSVAVEFDAAEADHSPYGLPPSYGKRLRTASPTASPAPRPSSAPWQAAPPEEDFEQVEVEEEWRAEDEDFEQVGVDAGYEDAAGVDEADLDAGLEALQRELQEEGTARPSSHAGRHWDDGPEVAPPEFYDHLFEEAAPEYEEEHPVPPGLWHPPQEPIGGVYPVEDPNAVDEDQEDAPRSRRRGGKKHRSKRGSVDAEADGSSASAASAAAAAGNALAGKCVVLTGVPVEYTHEVLVEMHAMRGLDPASLLSSQVFHDADSPAGESKVLLRYSDQGSAEKATTFLDGKLARASDGRVHTMKVEDQSIALRPESKRVKREPKTEPSIKILPSVYISDVPMEWDQDMVLKMHEAVPGISPASVVSVKMLPSKDETGETRCCIARYADDEAAQLALTALAGSQVVTSSGKRKSIGTKMARPANWMFAHGATEELRPGDWHCPECDHLNFAKNFTCRKCGHDKPEELADQNHQSGLGPSQSRVNKGTTVIASASAPPVEVPLGERLSGVIKRWNEERGFGFINFAGRDIFVHKKVLTDHRRDGHSLLEGEPVFFEAMIDPLTCKYQAASCSRVLGAPDPAEQAEQQEEQPSVYPVEEPGEGLPVPPPPSAPPPPSEPPQAPMDMSMLTRAQQYRARAMGMGGSSAESQEQQPAFVQLPVGIEIEATVKAWHPERGFGWVIPAGCSSGSTDVFLHRNQAQRDLLIGEVVVVTLEWDAARGKYKASSCTTSPLDQNAAAMFSAGGTIGGARLFIGGLPCDETAEGLVESLVSPHGELRQTSLVPDPSGPESQAALADMGTRDEAMAAAEAISSIVAEGDSLCVRVCRRSQNQMPSQNLYVNGLPEGMTEELVKELFSRHGTVQRLRLLTRPPPSPVGAMVLVSSVEEAALICDCFDRFVLPGHDQELVVKFADKKAEAAPPHHIMAGGPPPHFKTVGPGRPPPPPLVGPPPRQVPPPPQADYMAPYDVWAGQSEESGPPPAKSRPKARPPTAKAKAQLKGSIGTCLNGL